MVIKRIIALAGVAFIMLTAVVMPCYAVTGGIPAVPADNGGVFGGAYKFQSWSVYTAYIYNPNGDSYMPLADVNTLWRVDATTKGWTNSALTTILDGGYWGTYTYPIFENDSYDSVTGEQSRYMTYRPTLTFNATETDGESNTMLFEGMFYTRKVANRTYNGFRFEIPSEGVTDCSITWTGRVYWRDSTVTERFNSLDTSGFIEGPLSGHVGVDFALTDIIDFDTESYDDVIFVGTIGLTQDIDGGYVGVTNYYTRGANAETVSYDPADGYLSNTNYQGAPKVVKLLMQDAQNNSGGIIPSGTLTVTENGTYDVYTYDKVQVNVPTEVIEGELPNMIDWLIDTGEAFLKFEIAPGWYLASIFTFILVLSLVIWVIRLFMGG